MDEQREDMHNETQEGGYVPRPKWQVWGARIGLAVFILFLILYYALFSGVACNADPWY